MPEPSTLRVIITCSLLARSPTSIYPSSSPSHTPFGSRSPVQPHPPRPPRCLTPYPHHIGFHSSFPSPTPCPFPPSSSLFTSPSPLSSPSAFKSGHPYTSSSFPLSPSLSQSMSPLLNLPSPSPETIQLNEKDNGCERGMKTGRAKYPTVSSSFFFIFTFSGLPLPSFLTLISKCQTPILISFHCLHPP